MFLSGTSGFSNAKLRDPAHGTQRLPPPRSRRVRCGAWFGDAVILNWTLIGELGHSMDDARRRRLQRTGSNSQTREPE